MAQPQKRWPKNAEASRRMTIEAARDARTLLDRARREAQDNPQLTKAIIADVQAVLSDIQRWMTEAKVGVE